MIPSLSRRGVLRNVAGVGVLSVAGIAAATRETLADTWPIYSRGDEAYDVFTIQLLLGEHGYGLEHYTWIYESETERTVFAFQRDENLSVDGIVGPETWGALTSTVSRGVGMSGAWSWTVAGVQQQLITTHGYDIAYDGRFGLETETTVRDFQASRNLSVDGIVGPNTWLALVETG